jgi:putative transposase
MGRLQHRTSAGSTYFVTTKTWANRSLFQATETAEIVLEVLLRHRAAGGYLLHDFVLMPDHLHLLLTPGQTVTLERAMQLIKGGSSYEIHKRLGHRMEVWQPGFHERTVRDARDFQEKADYIWANPVVAKLVEAAEQWPYSSARGIFQLDSRPQCFASGAKAPSSTERIVGAEAPTPYRNGTLRPPAARDEAGPAGPAGARDEAGTARLAARHDGVPAADGDRRSFKP